MLKSLQLECGTSTIPIRLFSKALLITHLLVSLPPFHPCTSTVMLWFGCPCSVTFLQPTGDTTPEPQAGTVYLPPLGCQP